MIPREKILSLLGTGLPPETVALAVGCDPSYISQLLSNEAFREEVQLARLQNLTEATNRDSEYNKLEDELLGKLKDSLGFLIKPRDILTALAIINKAERRGAPPIEQTLVNNTIVNLVLPQKVRMEFTTNSDHQVVAVNNRSMLTLESNRLTTLAERVRDKTVLPPAAPADKAENNDAKRLPEPYPGVPKLRRGVGNPTPDSAEDLSDEELLRQLT